MSILVGYIDFFKSQAERMAQDQSATEMERQLLRNGIEGAIRDLEREKSALEREKERLAATRAHDIDDADDEDDKQEIDDCYDAENEALDERIGDIDKGLNAACKALGALG